MDYLDQTHSNYIIIIIIHLTRSIILPLIIDNIAARMPPPPLVGKFQSNSIKALPGGLTH